MELTRFQKIMLMVLAGMLAAFGVLMAAFRAHPGVTFEEGLLKVTERDGQTVYSGRAQGTPVTITVSYPTNFKTAVDFAIGDQIHDVCQVEYPTGKIETERGYTVNGIRVTKNGRTVFEGGYDPEDEFGWFDASGEWDPLNGVGIHVSGVYADPWQYYETDAGDIVRFAFGPETAAYGDPALFVTAVFLSVFIAVYILFWKTFFRWRHWAARDPEPSEGYEALEQVSWVVLTGIAAVLYVVSLTNIC